MSDVAKLITDYGITVIIVGIFLFLVLRYVPRFIDQTLKRMENKNWMIDTLNKTVDNNTDITREVMKVIENNSLVIKNYTDNAHKLEKEFVGIKEEMKKLRDAFDIHAQDAKTILVNSEILKEKK